MRIFPVAGCEHFGPRLPITVFVGSGRKFCGDGENLIDDVVWFDDGFH